MSAAGRLSAAIRSRLNQLNPPEGGRSKCGRRMPVPRIPPGGFTLGGLSGCWSSDGAFGGVVPLTIAVASASTELEDAPPPPAVHAAAAGGRPPLRTLPGGTTCTGIVPSCRRDPPRTATTVIVYVPGASGRWWNLPEKGTRLRPRLPRTVALPATAQLGRGPRTTRMILPGRLNRKLILVPRREAGPRVANRLLDACTCGGAPPLEAFWAPPRARPARPARGGARGPDAP